MILTHGDHDGSGISFLSAPGLAVTIGFHRRHQSEHTGTQVLLSTLKSRGQRVVNVFKIHLG